MIRLATIDDVVELIEFTATGFGNYEVYARHGINTLKIEQTLVGLIQADTGFILVDEQDGEIAGSIAGVVMEMGYCDGAFATDLCFYVKPEHKKKGIGIELFKAFVQQCRIRGANEIRTGATTGENGDIIEKFCQECGFTRRGVLYDLHFGE